MALDYTDVLARQPELSYVPPQNFFMVIDKLPQVAYNLQQVTIPPLSGGETQLDNRFNSTRTFIPGDGVDYSQLTATFLIDKEFQTYLSIVEWIKGINAPEGHEQYPEWLSSSDAERSEGFARTMSTVTVLGTDSAGKPVVHWVFKNAFPVSVDGPTYDATQQDIEYLTATVDFRYHYFETQTYNNGVLNNDRL